MDKSKRGIWKEEFFCFFFLEGLAGYFELVGEIFLKVIMVKIEFVWEGMENSCFCLGFGVREVNG